MALYITRLLYLLIFFVMLKLMKRNFFLLILGNFLSLFFFFQTQTTYATSGVGQPCTGNTTECETKYPGQNLSCQRLSCHGSPNIPGNCTGQCFPASGFGCEKLQNGKPVLVNGKPQPDNSRCKNNEECLATPKDLAGEAAYTCQLFSTNSCLDPKTKKPDNSKCQNGWQCLKLSGQSFYNCQPKPGAQNSSCDPSKKDQCTSPLVCLSINAAIPSLGECEMPPQGPTDDPPPPSPPCLHWDGNGVCQTFGSTFGAFYTNPDGLIQKIFAVLLSVSGGIALLLIMKAGYQMMTAQGNPEKLNNAREQLVAAIVGLIFLIFSFVFLQLIGFDILRIPGFQPGQSTANNTPVCAPNSCIPMSFCNAKNPGRCNSNGCPSGKACVQ